MRDSGGVRIEGLARAVNGLIRSGVELQDLKAAFGRIADLGVELASRFAPIRTGALRRSIRGSKAKNKATVRAGGARLRYAGPINYGWPRREIQPNLFLQRAETVLRPDVLPILEREINTILERQF
ncbi:hypothetical protein SAMN04489716_1628 [Actinoplanes derwentensis]|uniref:Uncharacterized protein n=1 Tax=Actinoplanes derwentensis TaxID=113562 RepID=A0A1H1V4R6_9ACTN|nr:hypothetical protein Ade03nite_94370 [Actinoplanes derwentensis]SDS79249.1 hypothetical protein SAMN04489716_1628 [Actinoplanes derwentensis]